MMMNSMKISSVHLKHDDDEEDEALLEEALFGKDFLTDYEANNTSVEILIDKKPLKRPKQQVWHDDDDEEVVVNLDTSNRLKKLKDSKHDSFVTGTVMTEKLRERFQTRQLKWAKIKDDDVLEMNKDSGIDQEDLALLYQTGSMVSQPTKKKPTKQLLPGHVDIVRLVNANIAEPSKQPISAINFHSSSNLLVAAGQDRVVRFFRIDGDKNPKQLSFRVQDMKIDDAKFLGDDVIVVGRKPFFYSYNTTRGSISKIPGPPGREVKSLEHMTISPKGEKLAFRGASGYIHICNGTTKQWMMELKMNTSVRSMSFIDDLNLVTSGLDSDIYLWDLRMSGRCLQRFSHDDGSCNSSLSSFIFPNTYGRSSAGFLSVGSESGVVSLFNLNKIDHHLDNNDNNNNNFSNNLLDTSFTSYKSSTKQIKSIMNLTTTITSTAFHPSGELLAIASNQVIK